MLLPGEATVYVGSDFVGRMRLPLVAAGEPFIAGFGVDPQLQVSRRLVHKSRSVQGGNQIFDYEFRIGLRNYRPTPVKVQLWDRLPKPQGEAVAVNLVKTSSELSTDVLYQRTARMDNLLRWDVDRAPGYRRRQDVIPELRVPPGVRPRPSPAPLRLRRPARRPHRRRRHGRHGRHGRRNAIGRADPVVYRPGGSLIQNCNGLETPVLHYLLRFACGLDRVGVGLANRELTGHEPGSEAEPRWFAHKENANASRRA